MNIDKLDAKEREIAYKLLESLGISEEELKAFSSPKKKKKKKHIILEEYIHIRETNCLLCKDRIYTAYKMKQTENSDALKSHELDINSLQFSENGVEVESGLGITTAIIFISTCNYCKPRLLSLEKECLIEMILDRYRR